MVDTSKSSTERERIERQIKTGLPEFTRLRPAPDFGHEWPTPDPGPAGERGTPRIPAIPPDGPLSGRQ